MTIKRRYNIRKSRYPIDPEDVIRILAGTIIIIILYRVGVQVYPENKSMFDTLLDVFVIAIILAGVAGTIKILLWVRDQRWL